MSMCLLRGFLDHQKPLANGISAYFSHRRPVKPASLAPRPQTIADAASLGMGRTTGNLSLRQDIPKVAMGHKASRVQERLEVYEARRESIDRHGHRVSCMQDTC